MRTCFVCDGKGELPRNYHASMFQDKPFDIRNTPKTCPCCSGTGKTDRRAARDLYGTHLGELCFIIGCGPSIEKAERYLSWEREPHVFRIALNRAIERIPADYWMWIDGSSYLRDRDCVNARAARRLGVDYFSDIYDPSVYVWERALRLPEDVRKLKVLHRATSLVAAINMACLLGAVRIVTVGCDHRVTDEYIESKRADIEKDNPNMVGKPIEEFRKMYEFTFTRINKALSEMELWKPDWVTVADASEGDLPIPKTWINRELEMCREAWGKIDAGKAVIDIGTAIGA